MLEISSIDTDSNLLDASVDTDSAYDLLAVQNVQDTSESAAYIRGTLEAETFSLVPDRQTTVISGNGNIDYGTGVYDTLDLSTISVSQVAEVNFAANPEGGTVFDVGDGERAFDSITLDDGRQVIFEGIENIVFADDNIDLAFSPDDTSFDDQFNLHMMGVQTAWQFTQGTDDVLIGVQDTGLGVDPTGNLHPDLRAEFFDPENVVDEFIIADVPEDISHGTAVQGIIGAETDNGVGIAGINWNSDIDHIDVIGSNAGDIDFDRATQLMIDQAVSQGQKLVINMSFGDAGITPDFEALIANNQDDVLFVMATGNDSATEITDPSSLAQQYDNVVAVGAAWGRLDKMTGESVAPGTIAEFSNTGEGITLVGSAAALTTSADPQGTFDYAEFGGTSAATPNVAGVASLVWSANSNLTATQVKQIMSETAFDLGEEGYDLTYGSGFVNADAAVRRAIAIGQDAPATATLNTVSSTISDTNSSSFNSGFSVLPETGITTASTFNERLNDTVSQDSTNDNLLEPSDADLPTSLFDYDAPELQNLAKLDSQLIQDDLFSSPLY